MAPPVLFMPDHHADPLWDLATEHMVSLDGLPVSGALGTEIRTWAERWDALASSEVSEPAAPAPETAWAELDRDGRGLWQRLQAELGPNWRVGWATFPGDRRHVQWEPDGPLELCLPGTWSR